MTPYYSRDGVTIYCGDCRLIMPLLPLGTIVTDPPYPDINKGFLQTSIDFLNYFSCHQLIFWSAIEKFPLGWSAIHIWHKANGRSSQHYERIFERNGLQTCRVFQYPAINSIVAASMARDNYFEHPTQKPIGLMIDLITKLCKTGPIIDPFMGSGPTLEAGYKLGYEVIGIEINEEYCKMAVDRLTRLPLRFTTNGKIKAQQLELIS